MRLLLERPLTPPPLIQMESGGGTGLGSVRFFCTILERNLSCFCRSRGQNTILFLIASILSQHFYHKHDNLVFFSPCFAYQKEGERRGGVVCAVSMNNPFFLSSLSLSTSRIINEERTHDLIFCLNTGPKSAIIISVFRGSVEEEEEEGALAPPSPLLTPLCRPFGISVLTATVIIIRYQLSLVIFIMALKQKAHVCVCFGWNNW